MSKFILVSCSDESMEIKHQVFNSLSEANDQMFQEWANLDFNRDNGDYFHEREALINNGCVYLWKIIEVQF